MANQLITITDSEVRFEKECLITKKNYSVTITPKQYEDWCRGKHIQNVLPDYSPAQREFIISGFTPDEWYDVFWYDEEDEEDLMKSVVKKSARADLRDKFDKLDDKMK